MEHVKVIGFYKDIQNETQNEKLSYIVVFENSYNDHLRPKKWMEGYNVIDGHFVLRDENYLSTCEKITKEEYLQATQGFYTPNEYL